MRTWPMHHLTSAPCHVTQTYEELVDDRAFQLMQMQKARYGVPCAGSTSDIWSLASCRESFACLRVSFVLDGDLIEQLTGN